MATLGHFNVPNEYYRVLLGGGGLVRSKLPYAGDNISWVVGDLGLNSTGQCAVSEHACGNWCNIYSDAT